VIVTTYHRAMKWLLAIALVGGCSNDGGTGSKDGPCHYQDHDYAIGDTWPAGDDCNDCTCSASGYTCTARPCHAPADANPATLCQPSGPTCQTGPACGAICCASGERCELGVCHCGGGSACPTGDACAAAGPQGEDACGSICCGATGPCPL
jgi:hypothetical protein